MILTLIKLKKRKYSQQFAHSKDKINTKELYMSRDKQEALEVENEKDIEAESKGVPTLKTEVEHDIKDFRNKIVN